MPDQAGEERPGQTRQVGARGPPVLGLRLGRPSVTLITVLNTHHRLPARLDIIVLLSLLHVNVTPGSPISASIRISHRPSPPSLSPLSIYPRLFRAPLSELTPGPGSLDFLGPPLDHRLPPAPTPGRHDGVLRDCVPPVQVGSAGRLLQVVLLGVLTRQTSVLFSVVNLCELVSRVKLRFVFCEVFQTQTRKCCSIFSWIFS